MLLENNVCAAKIRRSEKLCVAVFERAKRNAPMIACLTTLALLIQLRLHVQESSDASDGNLFHKYINEHFRIIPQRPLSNNFRSTKSFVTSSHCASQKSM